MEVEKTPSSGTRGPAQDDLASGESDTEVDDFIVDDQGRPVKSEERSHSHANRWTCFIYQQ